MLYSVSPEYTKDFPPLIELDISDIAEDGSYQEEIKTWNSYRMYLGQFCAALLMLRQLIGSSVKDADTKAKIDKAIHALYVACQGVDEAFRLGVADMRNGKQPEYHFEPVPPPPWPDPDNPQSFFRTLWNIGRPILQELVAKLAKGSPFATAVAGMIDSGDKIVKILDGVTLPELSDN